MFRTPLVLIFLLFYFLFSMPIQLAMLILQQFNMNLRNKISLSIVKWGLKCVYKLSGAKLHITGLENIPEDEACLFIGNHTSYYDIIVTYPLMKGPTGYLAKKEIRKIPCLSWWMYFVNCIFLDRDDPRQGLKCINKCAEYIKNGISIFVFPEGTRMKDGKMGEFKDGSMKIATKSKCPIIPVGITGTHNLFEAHVPWIKKSDVYINFGKPIYTKNMSRDEFRTLTSVVHTEVEKLIK